MKKILTLFLLMSTIAVSAQTDFDKKLKELNVELFPPVKPMANYVKAVRTGNLIYLAGHGPTKADGSNITGKVGKDLTGTRL
jgi:Putative translation initiation inhibitor, yjgF family